MANDLTIIDVADLPPVEDPSLEMLATITDPVTSKTFKVTYEGIRVLFGIDALKGGVGNAVFSTVPLDSIGTYNLRGGAGTYANFLVSVGVPLTLSAPEVSSGLWQAVKNQGATYWHKEQIPGVDISGKLDKSAIETVYQEEYVSVNGKEASDVWTDNAGNVLFAIFKDQTTTSTTTASVAIHNGLNLSKSGQNYTFSFGTTEGLLPLSTDMNSAFYEECFLDGKAVLYALCDANLYPLEVYFTDGTNNIMPSGLSGVMAEVTAARGTCLNLNERMSDVIYSGGMPLVPSWGKERMKYFKQWKTLQSERYDLVLIGDSYTEGQYYSSRFLSLLLSGGYTYGGAGFLGFARYGTTLATVQQSIRSSELSCSYTIAEWTSNTLTSFGVCGHVTSAAANAIITITATVETKAISILYERHVSAGSFQYRINGGSYTVVSTANATQDIQELVLNTSALSLPFTVDIQAINTGVNIIGAIGRNPGNTLQVHKCGISGGQSSMFGITDLWTSSLSKLTPKGMIIMFGTNEQFNGVSPATMKTNLQNIITKARSINPMIDIVIACPTQTQYESEIPSIYKLAQYAQIMFELAQENSIPYLNHAQIFGAFSQALIDNNFMSPDRVHPGTPKGGQVIAETFFQIFK